LNEAAGAALKLLQQWECQRHPRRWSARLEGNNFRDELAAAEVDAVIPPMTRRTAEIAYDANA